MHDPINQNRHSTPVDNAVPDQSTARNAYVPPFPDPRKSKPSLLNRMRLYSQSWLNVFFVKSYKMKTGYFGIPGKRFFIINQPDLVRSILVSNAEKYPKSSVLYQMLNLLIGDGIFISNGKTWKRQRKMMEQAMTASHIRRVFPLMQAAVTDFITAIKATPKTEINVSEGMAFITADIIFRTIFSKPLTQQESKIIFDAFAEYQEHTIKISPLLFLGLGSKKFRKRIGQPAQNIRQVIKNKIAPRLEEFQRGPTDRYDDILSGLINAQDDEGQRFSLEELIDQVATIFLAGHETSASTLSWALYILAQCPHLQIAIRQEITELHQGRESGEFIYEDIRKLKNTSEVFKETLRLYPPVGGFMRQSNTHDQMRDKQIKPGDGVAILPWLLHRREDVWPDAHAFCPARFSDPDQKDCIKDYYFPYSAGQRVCIGASFANQESILILASLVKAFEIQPVEGNNPMPVGHITIKPDVNILVKLNEAE